jgi:hypothetical protein
MRDLGTCSDKIIELLEAEFFKLILLDKPCNSSFKASSISKKLLLSAVGSEIVQAAVQSAEKLQTGFAL